MILTKFYHYFSFFTVFMLTRWIIFINIILATMLGYGFVQLLFSWNSDSYNTVKNPDFSAVTNNSTSLKTVPLNISDLLESHFFGQKQMDTPAESVPIPQATDTQLDLKLQGIFFTSDGHGEFESWAMIAHSSGKTGIYTEGSALSINRNLPLPAGAILYKIDEKQVILSRNGRYESLRFEENGSSRNNSTADTIINPDNSPIIHDPSNEKSITNDTNPSQLLGKYQQQLRTRPESLMQLVRIYPVNESGNFIGYKLKEGHDPKIMSQFGLESGDIVTAVNGVTLDSPLKGLSLIQQLATADRVDLQLLRNGQTLSLSFTVDQP
jgi:general secretion pathway protein C